jgi:hypothetical protein
MNGADDEIFVEKLLKDLPKAPEMSQLEIKRFEKQIDLLVEDQKKKENNKRWIPQLSAVASVVVLLAGFVVFTNSSEILKDDMPISSPSKEPVSPGPKTPGNTGSQDNQSDSENNDKQEADKELGEYDASEASKPDPSMKSVPVLRTGIDYEVNLNGAKNKIIPLASKGSFNELSSAQIACSVELGVRSNLYAIDRGTYSGESIEAYYFGNSKSELKIKIVSYGCNLLTELE